MAIFFWSSFVENCSLMCIHDFKICILFAYFFRQSTKKEKTKENCKALITAIYILFDKLRIRKKVKNPTVNQRVAGSSPAWGAENQALTK